MNENKFNNIPASACILMSGEFELASNGEGSKSAPIKLKARSGQPIEHWFWGRVVHDLSGMRLNKSSVPLDYVHDSKEVIGYANHFDFSTGDLFATGALTPFKDSDRATEIIFKKAAGVPYEASINFGGDGIKFQEVLQGEFVAVNGYQFEGPGVIIREWPLRGIAVCPYGADSNTDSSLFGADSTKVFHASAITAEPETPTEEGSKMSKSVDVAAQAEAEAAKKAESDKLAADEAAKLASENDAKLAADEAEKAKLEEDAKALSVEGEGAKNKDEDKSITRSEFTRIADEFGAEIAAETVRNGGSYESALKLAFDTVKAERDNLAKALSVKPTADGAIPVKEQTNKKPLFSTGA